MSTTVTHSKRHLDIDADEINADLNGTINTSTTAVTQSTSDNSTKVSTTAFVKAQGYITTQSDTQDLSISARTISLTDGGSVVVPAPTWSSVTSKPTTFAPIIGTTSSTAMAGNTTIPSISGLATTGYVDAKTWNWNDITAGTVPTFNQNTTGNAGTVTNGVYTTGTQTIGGAKTFTAAVTSNPASGVTAFTTASGKGYSIGSSRIVYYDGTTYLGNIDNQGSGSTIIRSAGNNTLILDTSNNATFAGDLTVSGGDITSNGAVILSNSVSSPVLRFGDVALNSSVTQLKVRVGGSDALTINSSQNATFAGDLTVSGGDITLGGTGRIQGIDTVSSGTDAANKDYVDTAVAGVPVGDITGVTAGSGLSGGGTSGTVTLVNTAPNIVQTTVTGNAGTVTNGVYTTGDQTIAGTKTFSGVLSASGAVRNVISQNYVDVYIYGDDDTYYPVTISGAGSHYGYQKYSVSRRYNWTAPSTWNTSTHQGALVLTWEHGGDTAWGGNDKDWRVIQFDEVYSNLCNGMVLPVTEGMVVWLRGGGTGGARYAISTPQGAGAYIKIYDNKTSGASGSGTHQASTTFTAGDSSTYSAESYSLSSVNSRINEYWPIRGKTNHYRGQHQIYAAIDEDNFASNSATRVPTQQSTKAYVDNHVWDGNDITSGTVVSARLDADTAHLSTTQTFTGAKTFTGTVALTGTGRITGVDTVTAATDAANKGYVDDSITDLIGGAPTALNTLNELAAAIDDDASYASTLTTALATKLPLAGGTLTGNLNLTYAYPRINLTDTNNDSDYSIINNDGTFSIYDVTNNSHRLSISAAGNATFAGSITASNLSGTNTGDQTLPTLSSLGALSTSGGTMTGALELGVYASTVQGVLKLNGSTANKQSVIKTTNGNLHIDAADGHSMYLNYYSGASTPNIVFGSGNGGASGASVSGTGVITATGGNSTEWNTAYDKTLQWDGGATALTASTGRTSLGLGSLATLNSVAAGQIDANAVNASELNVSGNGTTSQYLRSDGDGTMSWATPPDNNTVYTHPTTAGNKHIPTGGSSGQFLKYSSSGTAVWAADNNTTYSVGDGGLTQKNFTTTLKTKLDGIATNANNYTLPFTNNSTNWNTAYTDRNKWDGGATGLVAATGRTSLGLGTAATTASTAYATSAQGTLATNALPKAGGTMTGNLTMTGSPVLSIATHTGYEIDFTGTTGATNIRSAGTNMFLLAGTGKSLRLGSNNVNTELDLYDGNLTCKTNINPDATTTYDLGSDALRWWTVFCETLDSAGLHEKNLSNKDVGDYPTGTVLVWANGKAVPSINRADYMKIGIAVEGMNSPLVHGAEPVLCTGPVSEGDYLVTSRKEGHAVAMKRQAVKEQGLMDCVIGKALMAGDGGSHLVKTWLTI